MSRAEIAKNILWDDSIKVILIESDTGAFEVVKAPEDEVDVEDKLKEANDIYTYCQELATCWLIHPDDVYAYLMTINEFIRKTPDKRLDGVRFYRKLRYRVGGEYIWTSFEVVYPKGFPDKTSDCVFVIRRADAMLSLANRPKADISNLASDFRKVLKINIELGTFETIRLPRDEIHALEITHEISAWFASFVAAKQIHNDDVEAFEKFTDIKRIRGSFAESSSPQRFKYRRLVNGEFKKVSMDLVPCIEFSPKTPNIMLFVRDDEDTLEKKSSVKAPLDPKSRDEITGLRTMKDMQNDISDIENAPIKDGIGVIYAELNGLPHVISVDGKEAGNSMIRDMGIKLTDVFLEHSCYRISIDEFAVVMKNVQLSAFMKWAGDLRNSINVDSRPIASIGYAWDRSPETIQSLLDRAETMMRLDRDHFFEKHPDWK